MAATQRTVDARLTESERLRVDAIVTALAGVQKARAALDARDIELRAEAEAIAAARASRVGAGGDDHDMSRRCIAAELGAALRVNDRAMQAAMADAACLAERFPLTLAALREGRIDRAHVHAIRDAGYRIADAGARAAFETVVLERAANETPGRVRAFARQLAERLNPRDLAERHAEARAGRAVSVRDVDEGMAELVALLPTAEAHGIFDRLTRQARAIRVACGAADTGEGSDDAAAGDPESAVTDTRRLDEVRADVFTDILLTGRPAIDPTIDSMPGGLGAIRAHVELTIPVTTLTGETGSGAELNGRAPVDPETARRLAGECTGWDRVMVHPVTGIVLAVDRYRPSEELRRTLRARDRHCRFPGCRMPATRCDIDHTHDAALGGETALCNLACFCKRHHTLKHATDWTVVQLGDGALRWTSPTGREYIEKPPPRVVFLPDDDPPPF
jgi:hypothetical protein